MLNNKNSNLFMAILLRIINSSMYVFIAILLKNLVDYIIDKDMSKFSYYIIFIIIFFIIYGMIYYFSNLFLYKYIENSTVKLKNNLFEAIISKKFTIFKSKSPAEYISNLTNDINEVTNNYLYTYITLIGDICMFLLTIVVLLYLDPFITICMICSSLLLFVVPYIFGKPLQNKRNLVSEENALYISKIKELFEGYSTIHSYNLFKTSFEESSLHNKRLESSKFELSKVSSLFSTIANLLGLATLIMGICLTGYMVILGKLTPGSVVAIIQLSSNITNPLQSITQKITVIKSTKGVKDKLLSELTVKDPVKSKDSVIQGNIVFENVSFEYEDGRAALRNISFTFEKGKKYGLFGESGSGKSTLIKLISGYNYDYSGEIKFGNKSLESIDCSAIYKHISIVEQEPFFFNKSIKENIILNKDYDSNLFKKVCEITGLESIITEFPNGYDTKISDFNSNMSGGQKQRIAIARALYYEKQYILLDEPTSALDLESSLKLEKEILNLKDVTIIMISHKYNVSTLKLLDEIVILDNGGIIETGEFYSLLKGEGVFSKTFKKDKDNGLLIS